MFIPTFGGGDGSNGSRGGGCLHNPLSEYHIPVHCNLTNTGTVSSGGEESGRMGEIIVVVTGGYWYSGSEDSGGVATGS